MSAGGGSYTLFQLAMANGYFINDNFELGANFSILKAENTDAFGELSGFLSIHFPHSYDSRTVPYIGTQIGFGYGRGDDNPIIFGGYAGVKIFVTEGGGAFSLQAYYTRQSFENGGINNFGVLNGVSIFF